MINDPEDLPFENELITFHQSDLQRQKDTVEFLSIVEELPINAWTTWKDIKLKASNFCLASNLFFNGVA